MNNDRVVILLTEMEHYIRNGGLSFGLCDLLDGMQEIHWTEKLYRRRIKRVGAVIYRVKAGAFSTERCGNSMSALTGDVPQWRFGGQTDPHVLDSSLFVQ
jgi:hypothetical protein